MASIVSKKQKRREKYKLSDLKALGRQLLSSITHINNLPLLLTFVNPTSPPHHVLESILSLQSFFTPLLSQLPSSSSSSKRSISVSSHANEDPEFKYNTWLRSNFDEFVKSLIDICISTQSEETLREVVLDTIMEFVKLGNGGGFNSSIYHKFIHSIVHSALEVDFMLDLLASKYFNYIDVRYFTYISLEKIARTLEAKNSSDNRNMTSDGIDESYSNSSTELSIHKIIYILLRIPPLEGSSKESDYEMWSGSGLSSKEAKDKHPKTGKSKNSVLSAVSIGKKMKLKFTKAWISFLRLPLPIDVYKESSSFMADIDARLVAMLRVLVTLHQAVIPHLSNPIMLCDFLTRSYDIGGVISVMALSSLFVLMTQHGLEYPNFYEKLYALLAPSIFMAKHRARFFELLDSCLKSPLLPAYLAASFAKKLSRLALSAPPSGDLVIIALIHNLLRRHPSINCLVHREDGVEAPSDNSKVEELGDGAKDSYTGTDKSSRTPGIDHFKNEESDPLKTNAMRSSLWEIDTLRHHYCPPVSRFVLSLENDLTVRSKTTEVAVKDFSAGSYATIFGEEIRRRVKQVPLAFYKATPTCLFSDTDFAGWTFKHEDDRENNTGTNNGTKIISEEDNHSTAKRQRIECF